MTASCAWCGTTGRELVTIAHDHACTDCWDGDELTALRRLLAARAELDTALTVCGIDPHTGTLTDPRRDTHEAVQYLAQVTDRLRHLVAQARTEITQQGGQR